MLPPSRLRVPNSSGKLALSFAEQLHACIDGCGGAYEDYESGRVREEFEIDPDERDYAPMMP
jgi:hypothetical protein